jgi:hypothetical protein
MKRMGIGFLLAAISLTVCAVGCSDTKTETAPSSPESTEDAPTETKTAAIPPQFRSVEEARRYFRIYVYGGAASQHDTVALRNRFEHRTDTREHKLIDRALVEIISGPGPLDLRLAARSLVVLGSRRAIQQFEHLICCLDMPVLAECALFGLMDMADSGLLAPDQQDKLKEAVLNVLNRNSPGQRHAACQLAVKLGLYTSIPLLIRIIEFPTSSQNYDLEAAVDALTSLAPLPEKEASKLFPDSKQPLARKREIALDWWYKKGGRKAYEDMLKKQDRDK